VRAYANAGRQKKLVFVERCVSYNAGTQAPLPKQPFDECKEKGEQPFKLGEVHPVPNHSFPKGKAIVE